jgi:allograft inflammatory factor 1
MLYDDEIELGIAMEKIGKPKNALQLRKMIAEVDSNNSGTITFDEFLVMMLGSKSSVLRLILMYEAMGKKKEQPTGVAPKRSLADLP